VLVLRNLFQNSMYRAVGEKVYALRPKMSE
jgi:hypothetical protein